MNADQLAQACAEEMLKNDKATKALDMRLSHVSEGRAEFTMTVRDDMLNGHASCHGGMIFSLADTCFAFACNSQNHAAVAASCSIEFLRPAIADDVLRAECTMMQQGKRSGIYDTQVFNQKNDLIALFRGRSARINSSVIPEAN